MAHGDINLFMIIARLLVLIITLGMWTWSEGYLVLFEREVSGKRPVQT
jgi:hypothetical protein